MDTEQILLTLGLSIGLGLLVGLQRERKGDALAGIRTFALIALLGTLSALLAKSTSFWVIPMAGLGLAGLFAVGILGQYRRAEAGEMGLTTEVAAMVVFVVGAYLVDGNQPIAIAVGGAVALLLYWKKPLHEFVTRMGDKDVRAIMQFVLIALVILPILPRHAFDPYGALNPFEIWLVVVLVVGVSLGGYVAYKLMPPTTGTLLGGAIGGMISSTATTVAYARRSRNSLETMPLAAQAIMIANVISVLRVIVLVTIFAQEFALPMVLPLLALAGFMGVLTVLAWMQGRGFTSVIPDQPNPAELRPALVFGLLYAMVKLGTAWAKVKVGAAGLYLISVISGLTDVDAITLSMAGMTKQGGVMADQAWRVVMAAILSNLVFKFGCAVVLGSPRLARQIGLLFGLTFLAGLAILLYWP